MSNTKTPIEKFYENPKSKGFINHLIKSYLPVQKCKKFWDFKKGQKHKCNVCNQKLISISECLIGLNEKQKEIKEEFSEFINKTISNDNIKREDNPYIKHVIGNKVLGWTGEKTDTTLCLKCIKELLYLVQTGILSGDKNLIWISRKIATDDYFNNIHKKLNFGGDNKKVKEIQNKVNKKKKVTFGDLEVLKDLKKKLEKK